VPVRAALSHQLAGDAVAGRVSARGHWSRRRIALAARPSTSTTRPGTLDEPLTVDQLARRACLSRRTLIRRSHAETGLAPMQWLLGARVDRARELLEASDAPTEVVARQSGLGTPANLRTLFKRQAGVPPGTYRSTFRRTVPTGREGSVRSARRPGSGRSGAAGRVP
jgi:AraC-like DNA-binding protein